MIKAIGFRDPCSNLGAFKECGFLRVPSGDPSSENYATYLE